jgi:hypothetical protein
MGTSFRVIAQRHSVLVSHLPPGQVPLCGHPAAHKQMQKLGGEGMHMTWEHGYGGEEAGTLDCQLPLKSTGV